MNDFIYVPITMDDAEELGYDAKKAFAKGWGTSIDGWLKKIPVSEYLKSISHIQEDALSLYQPWPLHDVLNKLVEAAEILLHKKNYDGHGWEEIKHAVDAAKQYKPQRSPIQEDWKEKLHEELKTSEEWEAKEASILDKKCGPHTHNLYVTHQSVCPNCGGTNIANAGNEFVKEASIGEGEVERKIISDFNAWVTDQDVCGEDFNDVLNDYFNARRLNSPLTKGEADKIPFTVRDVESHDPDKVK